MNYTIFVDEEKSFDTYFSEDLVHYQLVREMTNQLKHFYDDPIVVIVIRNRKIVFMCGKKEICFVKQ